MTSIVPQNCQIMEPVNREDLGTRLSCFGSDYKIDGRHLLFGEYSQTWATLYLLILPINMHYEDKLNIDGGKHVLACF